MGLNIVAGISEYHFNTTFNVKVYILWKMEKVMVFLVYVNYAELCLANIFLICFIGFVKDTGLSRIQMFHVSQKTCWWCQN